MEKDEIISAEQREFGSFDGLLKDNIIICEQASVINNISNGLTEKHLADAAMMGIYIEDLR